MRRVLLLLLVLLVACRVAPTPGPAEIEAEEYAVYAALIEAEYLPGPGLIVLENRTEAGMDQDLERMLERINEKMPGIAAETLGSFRLRNAETVTLTNRLSLSVPYVLIDEQEMKEIFAEGGWDLFYERYPHSQGVMSLSRVGFNSDLTQALVYVGNWSHWVVGAGYYVLLAKERSVWVVRDKVMVWIS